VCDESVVGGGAGDVEREQRPEALVGAASPHELLAQRRRRRWRDTLVAFRSGGLRVVGVGEGAGFGLQLLPVPGGRRIHRGGEARVGREDDGGSGANWGLDWIPFDDEWLASTTDPSRPVQSAPSLSRRREESTR